MPGRGTRGTAAPVSRVLSEPAHAVRITSAFCCTWGGPGPSRTGGSCRSPHCASVPPPRERGTALHPSGSRRNARSCCRAQMLGIEANARWHGASPVSGKARSAKARPVSRPPSGPGAGRAAEWAGPAQPLPAAAPTALSQAASAPSPRPRSRLGIWTPCAAGTWRLRARGRVRPTARGEGGGQRGRDPRPHRPPRSCSELPALVSRFPRDITREAVPQAVPTWSPPGAWEQCPQVRRGPQLVTCWPGLGTQPGSGPALDLGCRGTRPARQSKGHKPPPRVPAEPPGAAGARRALGTEPRLARRCGGLPAPPVSPPASRGRSLGPVAVKRSAPLHVSFL